MIDPVVFANINSYAIPAFDRQRDEDGTKNQLTGIDLIEHQLNINLINPSESSRISAYTSRNSVHNEDHPQLTAMFPTSVDTYKNEEGISQNVEENMPKVGENTCTDCGKTFSERSFLLRHRIAHAEAKYICHICSRAFVRDDKLKRHVRCVHSNERPFVCEICAKAFARKDKLQEHARHHNRDITFTCPVCSDVFVMRSHLNRHLRSVHQIKQAINANSSSSARGNSSAAGRTSRLSGDECSGKVRMDTVSDGLKSGVAVDQMSTYSGNGLAHEKNKSVRSQSAAKRTRKKTAEPCLPVLGKPFSLSGSQLSAFSVPQPLMSTSSGAAVYGTEQRLASTESLSSTPMLQFPPTVQPQQLTAQYQFQQQQQQQQQQVAMQMRQHQQEQAYSGSTDMQATYFAQHQQNQQQHLQQQQQQQQQNPSSAFSAAMAASLFSPVNYVGWWPQANPSLMLHQSQQHSPYNNLTSGHQQTQSPGFLPSSNSTAMYMGSQPEGTPHRRMHQLTARQQLMPHQGLDASAGHTGMQYAMRQESPDAAAAAHVFASLPTLAQAVYYQAATLVATQSNTAPSIPGVYGAGALEQNAGNQFTTSPSAAFQLPANGPITN